MQNYLYLYFCFYILLYIIMLKRPPFEFSFIGEKKKRGGGVNKYKYLCH